MDGWMDIVSRIDYSMEYTSTYPYMETIIRMARFEKKNFIN